MTLYSVKDERTGLTLNCTSKHLYELWLDKAQGEFTSYVEADMVSKGGMRKHITTFFKDGDDEPCLTIAETKEAE